VKETMLKNLMMSMVLKVYAFKEVTGGNTDETKSNVTDVLNNVFGSILYQFKVYQGPIFTILVVIGLILSLINYFTQQEDRGLGALWQSMKNESLYWITAGIAYAVFFVVASLLNF